jgi:hypothetical protein
VSDERANVPAVVETAAPVTTPALQSSVVVPVMIADAGERAVRRFLEFFAASINNDNTRMAYYRAVCSFSPGSTSTGSAGWRISSRSMSPLM